MGSKREHRGLHSRKFECEQSLSRRFPPARWTARLLPCQLSDAVYGLAYLHECNIIHGNIKAASEFQKYLYNLLTDASVEHPYRL